MPPCGGVLRPHRRGNDETLKGKGGEYPMNAIDLQTVDEYGICLDDCLAVHLATLIPLVGNDTAVALVDKLADDIRQVLEALPN
jgi:hypothetical protein